MASLAAASTYFNGFVSAATMDTNLITPLNALLALFASDSGWINVPLAAGFVLNVQQPAYRLFGGTVIFRGQVKPTSGTFAINSAITVAAAGAIPAGFLPGSQASAEKQISGNAAAVSARAFVAADGSVQIATGATAAAYFSMAGLSGYIQEA